MEDTGDDSGCGLPIPGCALPPRPEPQPVPTPPLPQIPGTPTPPQPTPSPSPAAPTATPVPDAIHRQQLDAILAEIDDTELGAYYLLYLTDNGWVIVVGNPIAGGGFTYPWKRIVIKPGSYGDMRMAVAHELVHGAVYNGTLVDSIEQEYDAEFLSATILDELGVLPADRQEQWFGAQSLNVQEHFARIQGYSVWHSNLPLNQPTGLAVVWEAVRQGVGLLIGDADRRH